MAFKREKKVKGHSYHYLVQNSRQDGRIRQRILQYWGRAAESHVTKAYRDNIGPLTPIMAEELAKAELRWPEEQIMTAIHEAVLNNKLSWAYIITILQRYDRDGFTPPHRERREQLLKDPMAAAKAAGWTVLGDDEPGNVPPTPGSSDEVIIRGRVRKAASFDQLTAREQRTLELRFGLKDGECHTQRDTAKELDVCASRARELEVNALSKLYGDRLSLEERRQQFAEEDHGG